MSNEYDISRAFKRIENDLIDSMMRNMKRHQVEEAELGFEWEQWQALQLQELEEYRKKNAQLFGDDFREIQEKIDDMFWATYNDAQSAEEHRLMDRIKKGDFTPPIDKGSFFNLNEGKLQALLMATKADFARAEYAMLRRANDQYRKIIFDAMTYANVTNDYNKAVDMATKDFLRSGINCIVYKNGARHTVPDYARMALRTGNKRAYLMGEGNAHDRYGLHTVRVNKRPHACPKCVGFLGRLLIDDVYGGGTRAEATAMGIPTLSDAIGAGFLHPNCKDMYSVYIPEVSKPATPWTQEEISDIVGEYNQEQEIRHAEDMRDTYQRMAKYSLDPENKATYQQRADNWQARVDELSDEPPQPAPTPVPVMPTIPQPIAPVEPTPEPIATNVASQATSEDVVRDNIERIKAELKRKQKMVSDAEAEVKALKGREFNYENLKAEAEIFQQDISEVIEEHLQNAKEVYAKTPLEGNKKTVDAFQYIKDNLEYFQSGEYKVRSETLKAEIEANKANIDTLMTELKEERKKAVDILPPPKMVESQISKDAKIQGIARVEVKRTVETMTDDDIISMIAGGDQTSGSCASMSFTWAGRKAGLDVYDYRGGTSQAFFSKRRMKRQMMDEWGVVGFSESGKNDVKAVHALMDKAKVDKEYMVCTGGHSAILKKDADGNLHYLELQGPTMSGNGWHNLTDDKLRSRFGCKIRRKYESYNLLLDVESMGKNEHFADMLTYINTAEDAQKKGVTGSVK